MPAGNEPWGRMQGFPKWGPRAYEITFYEDKEQGECAYV